MALGRAVRRTSADALGAPLLEGGGRGVVYAGGGRARRLAEGARFGFADIDAVLGDRRPLSAMRVSSLRVVEEVFPSNIARPTRADRGWLPAMGCVEVPRRGGPFVCVGGEGLYVLIVIGVNPEGGATNGRRWSSARGELSPLPSSWENSLAWCTMEL